MVSHQNDSQCNLHPSVSYGPFFFFILTEHEFIRQTLILHIFLAFVHAPKVV